MLHAAQLVRMQDDATKRWHQEQPAAASGDPQPQGVRDRSNHDAPASESPDGLVQVVLSQHRANFDLWHEEDKARDPLATDQQIAQVKRAIDGLNQRRNDLVETLDSMLLEAAGEQNKDAPLHSESPGLMIDRLSILSLKLYHTAEEAERPTASAAHREKNRLRLAVLSEQRGDLAGCLDALWDEVRGGRRRFKLYRQMKMYNDPELNPAVYSRRTG